MGGIYATTISRLAAESGQLASARKERHAPRIPIHQPCPSRRRPVAVSGFAMQRTRHTPKQIISKMREADAMLAAGRPVAQIVQHLGVSEPTFARWRAQYGGMKSDEARR